MLHRSFSPTRRRQLVREPPKARRGVAVGRTAALLTHADAPTFQEATKALCV